MSAPSACVIFNNVDDTSGIGKLCAWSVRTALDAGWRVTVIARDLSEDLRPDVEWLPLYVPPKLHAVQWFAAAGTVRRAMGDRRWDVVHVQQPQLAPVADVLHLHYLVGAARERAPEPVSAKSLRSVVDRAQVRATEWGEDRYLRRLRENVILMPVSPLLAQHFRTRYGAHDRTVVLGSPAPVVSQISAAERRAGGDREGTVLGFLGGADPRKGGAALAAAVARTDGVVLLAGGHGEGWVGQLPAAKLSSVGHVADLRQFYAACDAFAAVSTFDPGPLTVLEAAAHGVPVIGTAECGFVAELHAERSALLWSPGEDLAPVIAEVRADGSRLVSSAVRVVARRSRRQQGRLLLDTYASVTRSVTG